MTLKNIYNSYKRDKTPSQYLKKYDNSHKVKILVARRQNDVVYVEHIEEDLYLCVRIEKSTVKKRTNNPMKISRGKIREEQFSGCSIQLIRQRIPSLENVDNRSLAYNKVKSMKCWKSQEATRKRPVKGLRSLKREVESYRG